MTVADIRLLLNDKAIARLPNSTSGWYLARDTELKGFFVVVGKRRKTFTVQGDLRRAGKRASTIRVSIGDSSEVSTRTARATARDYLLQISRGQHPNIGKRGQHVSEESGAEAAKLNGVTLQAAWERYRDAHMFRKGRSEGTIESYRDHVERMFIEWLDVPLKDLADDPHVSRRSTIPLPATTALTSRMGACGRFAQYIITLARPTKSFPQTTQSMRSTGTEKSAVTPPWVQPT